MEIQNSEIDSTRELENLKQENNQLKIDLRVAKREFRQQELTVNTLVKNASVKMNMFKILAQENQKHQLFLTHLMKNSIDFLILTDHELKIAYCSDSFLKIIGIVDFSQIEDKKILDVYKMIAEHDLYEQLASSLSGAIRQDTTWQHDILLDIDGSGQKRNYRIINTPMNDNNMNGLIIKWNDITDLINAKNCAEKATDDLARHSSLLSSVNDVSAILLDPDVHRFTDNLLIAVKMIAVALDIDSAQVWKNQNEKNNFNLTKLLEWTSENSFALSHKDELLVQLFHDSNDLLIQDKCIYRSFKDLKLHDQYLQEQITFTSIFLVPIFVKNSFWGIFALEDWKNERIFNSNDELIIRSASRMIAYAYVRNDLYYLLENLLNSITSMIYVTVPETGEILFMNDIMKEHYRIKGDVRGKICYQILQRNMKERCDFCPIRQLNMNPDQVVQWEEYRSFTGRSYHNTDRFIRWLDGKIVHLQHSVDMTEIIEAKKQAELGNRTKSEFLARMSHEIRTPMNVIIGIAQIQLQKNDLPEDMISAMEMIYLSGQNLLGIINDILDVSKVETGKMELIPIPYHVASLINDSVQLNITQIGTKSLEFQLDISADIPSQLKGDMIRLKQILNNLLSNAIKYTDTGHIKLTVDHFWEKEIFYLRFIVEDTGQGIKPEDAKKLFSEYSRFNIHINQSKQGTGLGLTITKSLIELMDGNISVETEYNKGSKFIAVVKQIPLESPIIGKNLSDQLNNFTYMINKHHDINQIQYETMPYGKVLIVDDMDTNLYVAKGLLTKYNLKIRTASSGFDVLEMIKEGENFDIIFMDHMMPIMNGIETTQKLREKDYKGIIVALTANAITGNEQMFIENGFDSFISKPINTIILDNVLKKYIKDKYPEEAKKNTMQSLINNNKAQTLLQKKNKVNHNGHHNEDNNKRKSIEQIEPKLFQLIYQDAKKSLATMKIAFSQNDIKLYTTNVHAMKTLLANIGETKTSDLASKLEAACINNDLQFVKDNNQFFISQMENLVREMEQVSTNPIENNDIILEDHKYLNQQLTLILEACDNYDDTIIYQILDRIMSNKWKNETLSLLNSIKDTLFLHSNFESVSEQVKTLQTRINK